MGVFSPGNKNLTKVNQNFDALTSGHTMFSNCKNLKSFCGNLDNLVFAPYMFNATSLESFVSALPSLTDGSNMFYNCKLDTPSVENILTSLQPFTDGSEHIMTMRIQSAAVE